MKTFYQFLLTYRGKIEPDNESRLAEWAFFDQHFPQYTSEYNEISDYLEWNSPFPGALAVFDELWSQYTLNHF
jgi:uncharacterized protein YozE (UPF0346 family)